jgi:stage V sporulation protein S
VVEVLKVSGKSNPNSVAGALAGVLRQAGAVDVQVVGAGALNQAIKAIAIARGFVAPSNIDLVCIPTFADIQIDGQSRTAIRLAVENRPRRQPAPTASTSTAPSTSTTSSTIAGAVADGFVTAEPAVANPEGVAATLDAALLVPGPALT